MPASPLDWSMRKSADGSSLAVSVTVTNTSGTPIWVADRLIVPAPHDIFTHTDRLTVMTTDDPEIARFVVGSVSSDRPAATLYGATFTRLAAGDSVERSYTVPLPLEAWNPVGGADPLSSEVTQAKLLFHTSHADPTGWSTLATSDAEVLKIPRWGGARTILEGKVLSLP